MAVKEAASYIVSIEVTTAERGDSDVFVLYRDRVEGEIRKESGESAYETDGTHVAIAMRSARASMPPR